MNLSYYLKATTEITTQDSEIGYEATETQCSLAILLAMHEWLVKVDGYSFMVCGESFTDFMESFGETEAQTLNKIAPEDRTPEACYKACKELLETMMG